MVPPQYIYIIELKMNQTAAKALEQIEQKGYADSFAGDPRKLFKIGMNFSTESKKFDDFAIQTR